MPRVERDGSSPLEGAYGVDARGTRGETDARDLLQARGASEVFSVDVHAARGACVPLSRDASGVCRVAVHALRVVCV